MTAVGFVGLGIMGIGMANNLAKVGKNLVVWNRSQTKAQEFASAHPGCRAVSTPKEVISACEITYLMLSDLEASKAVYFGEDGVLAGVEEGKCLVDCATLTPEHMTDLAERVTQRGGKFLEAPVSGSKVPAEQGTLIFLAGGDKPLYDRVKPDMEGVIGKKSVFLGAVGKGSEMKLVVNMVMGSMAATLAEGLCLAQSAGLPTDELLDVLDNGAMANPLFKLKGPKMVKGDHAPNFPLKHAQKDMRFALALGDSVGQTLPVAAAANELFKRARDEHGDADFSAVYEAVKK